MIMVKNRFLTIAIIFTMILSTFPVGIMQASAASVDGWWIESGSNAKPVLELDSNIKYSGDYSLHIMNKTVWYTSTYARYSTSVPVKDGVTYKFGFMGKAKNTSQQAIMVSWKNTTQLNPAGEFTYDWRPFEFIYTHSGADGNVAMTFRIEGWCDMWIDDVYFMECDENGNKIGENLIKNSTFDTIGADSVNKAPIINDDGVNLEDIYNQVMEADSFTVEDLLKIMSTMRTIPIKKAKDIKIDGDMSDWEDYTSLILPVLSSQLDVYADHGVVKNNMDGSAVVKLAFDEAAFYFAVEVKDHIHEYMTGSEYWKKDSVQFMLSGLAEGSNTEIGATYNEAGDAIALFAGDLPQSSLDMIEAKGKRTADTTTYELRIPWFVHFGEKPEKMKFDILINDDDGTGRAYGLEMAPGIGRHKSNAAYPVLEFMEDGNDLLSSWATGPSNVTINEKAIYDLYIVNYGDDSDVTVKYDDGTQEIIKLPKNQGIHKSIERVWNKPNNEKFEIEVSSGNYCQKNVIDVNVKPDLKMAEEALNTIKAWQAEINELLLECYFKNISVDYELIDLKVLELFIDTIEKDIKNNDLDRLMYTMNCLEENYNSAKKALTGYLNGTAEPVKVPKYVSSDVEIDGFSFMADAEYNGKVEKRPTFFVGYGHFQPVITEMENWKDLAMNTIQIDIGPSMVLRRNYGLTQWAVQNEGGAEFKIELSDIEKKSGNHSAHITTNFSSAPNRFIALLQSLDLKPNTTYNVGLSVKGNQGTTWYSAGNWDPRNYLNNENPTAWTDYTSTYTTGDNPGNMLRIAIESQGDIYIDDIYVYEEGSTENLVQNGDFEKEPENPYEFTADPSGVDYIVNALKKAEENDVSVALQLAPHYMLGYLSEMFSDFDMWRGSFIRYDVHHNAAKAAIEEFLRTLIPKIKDSKALHSISLSNEGAFFSNSLLETYTPLWIEFLKEKYDNSIDNLNKAYDAEYSSFDEVLMPQATNEYSRRILDYSEFNDNIFAEWHIWMRDIIHEMAPDIPLSAKPMPYVFNVEDINQRYFLFQGVNAERHAEFMDVNGMDGWYTLGDLLTHKDVEMVGDGIFYMPFMYDLTTSINPAPAANYEEHFVGDKSADYRDEIAHSIATGIWEGIIHRRNISDIWLWDYYERDQTFKGCIRYRPDAITEISKTALDANRLAYEITAIQNKKPEVGLLYSTTARVYDRTYLNVNYNCYRSILLSGQKAQIITDSTLSQIKDLKVLILPNTKHIKPELLQILKEFIGNGGKVIMVGEDCLKYDDSQSGLNDEATVNDLKQKSTVIPIETGDRLLASPSIADLKKYIEKEIDDSGIGDVKIINNETGEYVECFEYASAEYNDKLIVYICNFDYDNRMQNVSIIVDGQKVSSSKELRSGKDFGENFDVEFIKPILVEITK